MGLRAAAATLAAALIFVLPSTASAAPGDGVRIARDGDRLIVAGPPQTGVGIELSEGGSDGEIRIRAAFPARIEQAPVDCLPTALTEVRCPTWQSRVVFVSLGDADDSLSVGALPLPVDVQAGDGADDLYVGRAMRHDRFDGGPGRDSVNWYDRGETTGVTVRPVGVAGGEDQVKGAEVLQTTNAADDVVAGRDAEFVATVGGNDRVDLRDGRPNTTDCGKESGDVALVDPGDEVKCARVERPAAPPPPSVPIPSPSPLRAAYADLIATPRYAAGALHLVLLAAAGGETRVALEAAPWATPDAKTALGSASAVADGDGIARLAFTLPPPMREALERDGRLRVTGDLRLGDVERKPTAFTLFTWRAGRVPPNAVRRHGSFGAQKLIGTDAAELLTGASGDDLLDGRGGNDHLLGGTGNDRVEGAAGDDTLDGGDGDDNLSGGPGDDDVVEHRFGDDRLSGGDGDDVLYGARGGDAIDGGAGDDVLGGGSGSDKLDCGPGRDVAFVNYAGEEAFVRNCEEVYDEPGVVHLPCTAPGTAGPETMLGSEGPDACSGLAGDDDLEGRGGDDVLDAGEGHDRLFGRFGADRLLGGPGHDELEGGRGVDTLDGGDGNDQLNGGLENDVLFAGAGDDRLSARGGGRDHVDCGLGVDVAYVDSTDDVVGCERVHRSGRKVRSKKRRRG